MDCLESALSSCGNGAWLSEYSFVVLEHGIMDKKCGVCPEHSYDSLIGALQGKRITTPFSSTINGTTVICVCFVYPLESSNNVDLLFCSFQCFSNDSSLQCLKKRIAFFISRSRAFVETTCDSNYSFTLLLAEDYCTLPSTVHSPWSSWIRKWYFTSIFELQILQSAKGQVRLFFQFSSSILFH